MAKVKVVRCKSQEYWSGLGCGRKAGKSGFCGECYREHRGHKCHVHNCKQPVVMECSHDVHPTYDVCQKHAGSKPRQFRYNVDGTEADNY